MSKSDKLIQRLKTIPKDFTWDETLKILVGFGFSEQRNGKTGGARRTFTDNKNNIIKLHEPHPGSVLKHYAVKELLTNLTEKGFIQDE